MLNIIKSDIFRIMRGKAIYVALIILMASVVVSLVAMSPGYIGINMSVGKSEELSMQEKEMLEKLREAKTLKETREITKEYGEFELDKQILGTNINLYYFFIVVVFILICVDLSDNTVKNTLSSAISRKKYYLSKLVLSLLIGTILILINNYATYFLNTMINGSKFSSDLLEFTKITILQLPILYGIISILVCIAFITRKKSMYNGISIPLIMVIQLILMGVISLFRLDSGILTNWEAQYIISNLVDKPTTEYIVKTILLGIGYTIIFNIIGYTVFKKSEIK